MPTFLDTDEIHQHKIAYLFTPICSINDWLTPDNSAGVIGDFLVVSFEPCKISVSV